jgi:hypothetical protein
MGAPTGSRRITRTKTIRLCLTNLMRTSTSAVVAAIVLARSRLRWRLWPRELGAVATPKMGRRGWFVEV